MYIAIALFSLVLLAIGALVLQGLVKVQAQPPHKGVMTFLGKRTEKVLDEGWHFLPLYPFVFGVVPVNVTRVEQDFKTDESGPVRTPDRAELKILDSATWTPDSETKGGLIAYLNAGGEAGVRSQLEDIVNERLREWVTSRDEGPLTWEEAIAARDEAVAIIVAAILVDQLPKINSSFPFVVLWKYFQGKHPNATEKEQFGERWEKVARGLKKEDSIRVRDEVDARMAEIQNIRRGNGKYTLPKLGIVLNRFNITEISVQGEVAKVAELREKERLEKEADVVQIQNVKDRILELMKPPPDGPGFSPEKALEVVQTEQTGKVTKTITETTFNVSPETREFIKLVVPTIPPLVNLKT